MSVVRSSILQRCDWWRASPLELALTAPSQAAFWPKVLNISNFTPTPSINSLLPFPFLCPSRSLLFDNMMRTVAVRALRAASRAPVASLRQSPALRTQIPSLLQSSQIAPSFALPSIRCYSAPSGLSREEVQGRIMDLLKNFDKVRSSHNISLRSLLTL